MLPFRVLYMKNMRPKIQGLDCKKEMKFCQRLYEKKLEKYYICSKN